MQIEFYILAMPQLPDEDRRWIDHQRSLHDPVKAAAIGPHFTLGFAHQGLNRAEYLQHVDRIARTFAPFPFQCRRVTLGTDHASDAGYAFLVPDEGQSALLMLRDGLHTGILAAHQRPDIPFTPHITIGQFDSLAAAKACCDMVNQGGVCVQGRVASLTVVGVAQGAGLREMANFPLSAG